MRIKLILCLVSIILKVNLSFGQTTYSCEVLSEIINNERIIMEFHLDKRQNSFIAIIDSNAFFSNCNLKDMFGKEIKILPKTPRDLNPKVLNIRIEKIDRKKKQTIVTLYVKSQGIYGTVTLRKKMKKFKIKEVMMGNLCY